MRLGKAVCERFESNEPSWDQEPSWTGEQIGRRVNRLAQILPQAGAQIADLVIGTGRMVVPGDVEAQEQLNDGGDVISDLFLNVLRVINPDAQLKGDDGGEKVRLLSTRLKEIDLAPLGLGPVASRLAHLLRGLLLIVTRMIDLIIGVFAAGFAIATVGQEKEINGAAYEGLKSPRLIGDLLETLKLVVDPNSV